VAYLTKYVFTNFCRPVANILIWYKHITFAKKLIFPVAFCSNSIKKCFLYLGWSSDPDASVFDFTGQPERPHAFVYIAHTITMQLMLFFQNCFIDTDRA
jgi:hypothetical protein